MATEVTPEILDAIEAVLRQAPTGMTFDDLANAFDPPANLADMNVWLKALGDQRRVMFFRRDDRMIARLPPEFVLRSSSAGAAEGTSAAVAGAGGSARQSGEPDGSLQPSRGVAPVNGEAPDQTPPVAGIRGSARESGESDISSFPALFDQSVFPIVGGLMPRTSVTAFLQTQARLFFQTPEDRAGFMAYALPQIEALAPQIAEHYGLTAEQVSAWRAIYDADPSGCRAGSPGALSLSNALPRQARGPEPAEWARDAELVERANPAGIDVSSNRQAAEPPAAVPRISTGNSSRGQPVRPVSSGGNPAGAAATGGVSVGLGEAELRREIQGAVAGVAQDMAREIATGWDLRAAVQRAGAAMKATLSPGRALFAVVWACAVFWAIQYYLKTGAMHATAGTAQRFAVLSQALGLATVPLCGVPWLCFRWWDLRTRDGVTPVDVGVTLCVGGVVGLMLANVVVSLSSCVTGLIPK